MKVNFKELNFLWNGETRGISRVEKEDAYLIYTEAKESKLCIEIGRLFGGTTLLLAASAKKVISIDNHISQKPLVHLSCDRYCKKLLDIYGLNAILEIADSTSYGNKGMEIDFIFIDGNHSYEGVKADIKHWIPKVKNKGKIAFHDANMQSVQKAINRFPSLCLYKEGLNTQIWKKR